MSWLKCEFPHWLDTTEDKLLSHEGFLPVMVFVTVFSELAESKKQNCEQSAKENSEPTPNTQM